MKISEKWLRTWVDPRVTTQQLAETLTMSGLEVDAILYELPLESDSETISDTTLAEDDAVLELNITPNRGDCFSIQGIAREVGVLFKTPVKPITANDVLSSENRQLAVDIDAPQHCPHYLGRVISNVNTIAKTPDWMVQRLLRSGIRSISPVVDITNYVMLELGQPMHAFDLDKINEKIIVRHAKTGENLTLLDGKNITLDDDTFIIADSKKPIALAGIMGGEESSISEASQNIFLESAFFTPSSVAKSARRYQLTTDSQQRFERGVDFELQHLALERATALLLDIVGGKAGPITQIKHAECLPKPEGILVRTARVKRVLGLAISGDIIDEILKALGMTASTHPEGYLVWPPSHRFDITIEADIIEEIARIYGYDQLPSCQPKAVLSFQKNAENQLSLRRVKQTLVDHGFQEVITYSFVDETLNQRITPSVKPLRLVNPIASDMSTMRSSLWPGLLNTLIYNQNRQQERLKIFETGLCFINRDDQDALLQETHIAGLIAGNVTLEQWSQKAREVDFYDIKAEVEALLNLTGQASLYHFEVCEYSALHPGQSAVIKRENKDVGYLGALHPKIANQLDINLPLFLFELQLDGLKDIRMPHAKPLSKFPAIRRDLAFIVDESICFADIEDIVSKQCGSLLQKVIIFDIYRGQGIEPGKKSVALGMIFQDISRTLTDSEINQLMNTIIKTLTQEINATVRD